jgi:hypothetical protein
MAKRKNNKGANALKQINTITKRLQREHPNTSYAVLRDKAAAEYRNRHHHHKSRKKKTVKKKRVSGIKRNSDKRDNKRVNITVGKIGNVSTAQLKKQIRERAEEQLAWALLARDRAPLKRLKKKLSKKIAHYRSEIKKVS